MYDETLGKAIASHTKITDNVVDIDVTDSTIYGNSAPTSSAYRSNIKIKGRVSSEEIINIISNHKRQPREWTAEVISEYLHMRESDVENIVNYYTLLDEETVDWHVPKEIRWSEKYQRWLTGKELGKGATFKDLKKSIKDDKVVMAPAELRRLEDIKNKRPNKWNEEYVEELISKNYALDDKIKLRLLTPIDAHNKTSIGGKGIERFSSTPTMIEAAVLETARKRIEGAIASTPSTEMSQVALAGQKATLSDSETKKLEQDIDYLKTLQKRKPAMFQQNLENKPTPQQTRWDDNPS